MHEVPPLQVLDEGWFHVGSDGFDPAAPELAAGFDPHMVTRVKEWLDNGLRRGRTEWHDDYLLMVFVVPIMDHEAEQVWTRQILVLCTHDAVLTVDDSPAGRPRVDPIPVLERFQAASDRRPGRLVALIMDAVASAFVEIVDRFDSEANELEDLLEDSTPRSRQAAEYLRDRLKQFRSDLHGVRRSLQPTMEAVRQVVSGIDLKGDELFPSDIERRLRDTLDKLLYVADSFEGVRDEVTSLRDYMQTRIANDQNEIMKFLTIVAALVLIPTFIVGFFGQNFQPMPGLHHTFWIAVAVMAVIVVAEVVLLWWRGWIGNRGDSRVEQAMRSGLGRRRPHP
ncbi:MAG: CorA family divalent cation transporter [Actinobacteria bacterium]|nr:CorA family divalent cation transporter [Actinomycetota bacterium]